jgi:hypothetical protein
MLLQRGDGGSMSTNYTIASRFLKEITPGLLQGYYPAADSEPINNVRGRGRGGYSEGGHGRGNGYSENGYGRSSDEYSDRKYGRGSGSGYTQDRYESKESGYSRSKYQDDFEDGYIRDDNSKGKPAARNESASRPANSPSQGSPSPSNGSPYRPSTGSSNGSPYRPANGSSNGSPYRPTNGTAGGSGYNAPNGGSQSRFNGGTSDRQSNGSGYGNQNGYNRGQGNGASGDRPRAMRPGTTSGDSRFVSNSPRDLEAAQPPGPADNSFEKLNVGDSVMHIKFGNGKVVQVIGDNDKQIYNVEFEGGAGKKLLDPKFAKLIKLS